MSGFEQRAEHWKRRVIFKMASSVGERDWKGFWSGRNVDQSGNMRDGTAENARWKGLRRHCRLHLLGTLP